MSRYSGHGRLDGEEVVDEAAAAAALTTVVAKDVEGVDVVVSFVIVMINRCCMSL